MDREISRVGSLAVPLLHRHASRRAANGHAAAAAGVDDGGGEDDVESQMWAGEHGETRHQVSLSTHAVSMTVYMYSNGGCVVLGSVRAWFCQ